MSQRCTVRWHNAVFDDIAEIWLDVTDRASIARAVDEIDQILKLNPASKGRAFALARLDGSQADAIVHRIGSLPEELRVISFGPLECFYLPREDDAMVVVALIRIRRK